MYLLILKLYLNDDDDDDIEFISTKISLVREENNNKIIVIR